MVITVCDSLPILTMKIKVMQTGKGRGDAPLNLTVTKKELIICKMLYYPITASSKILDIDRSYMSTSFV